MLLHFQRFFEHYRFFPSDSFANDRRCNAFPFQYVLKNGSLKCLRLLLGDSVPKRLQQHSENVAVVKHTRKKHGPWRCSICMLVLMHVSLTVVVYCVSETTVCLSIQCFIQLKYFPTRCKNVIVIKMYVNYIIRRNLRQKT